jgi:hypothetical protein
MSRDRLRGPDAESDTPDSLAGWRAERRDNAASLAFRPMFSRPAPGSQARVYVAVFGTSEIGAVAVSRPSAASRLSRDRTTRSAAEQPWQHFGNVQNVERVGCVRKPDDSHDLDAGPPSYAGRPRLRALWTEWSVEVRVLSGASKKLC